MGSRTGANSEPQLCLKAGRRMKVPLSGQAIPAIEPVADV
jgi:hypothetical protein